MDGVTHAIEGTSGHRKVSIVRHADDTFVIQMVNEAGGKPLTVGCKLSRESINLLHATLDAILSNLEAFKVENSDGQKGTR